MLSKHIFYTLQSLECRFPSGEKVFVHKQIILSDICTCKVKHGVYEARAFRRDTVGDEGADYLRNLSGWGFLIAESIEDGESKFVWGRNPGRGQEGHYALR